MTQGAGGVIQGLGAGFDPRVGQFFTPLPFAGRPGFHCLFPAASPAPSPPRLCSNLITALDDAGIPACVTLLESGPGGQTVAAEK